MDLKHPPPLDSLERTCVGGARCPVKPRFDLAPAYFLFYGEERQDDEPVCIASTCRPLSMVLLRGWETGKTFAS